MWFPWTTYLGRLQLRDRDQQSAAATTMAGEQSSQRRVFHCLQPSSAPTKTAASSAFSSAPSAY